jgi:hypothetical protein
VGEPGLDGGGRSVTGSVPDMPDEPIDQASTDVDDGVTYGSYAEFLDREQPEIRPATYADKEDSFVVTRDDGSREVMTLVFKAVERDMRKRERRLNRAVERRIRRELRASVSSQTLTGLAVLIAGHERAVLGNEWRAHLSGETGAGLSADRLTWEAIGFVLAAVRYRLQDAADLVWRPVDAVLASRKVSNLVVLLVTIATAVISIHGNGLYGLVSNLANTAVAWGATFGLIHYGRERRDVKPPERKPRRERQQR